MKKVLLSLLLVCATASVYAQTEKGRIFLGANFSVSNSSQQVAQQPNQTNNSFTLSPEVGYFIADNFAVGLGLGFNNDKFTTSTTTTTRNSTSLRANLRYYLPTSSEQFKFFLEFGLGYSTGKTKDQFTAGSTTERKFNAIFVGLSPNFAYFPTKKWAIEFGFSGIGYQITNPEGDNNNTSSFIFGVNSFNPNLGIRAFF